ncbi:MAG TPA: hypothetical protein VMB34_18825 [Acetobacteraceae bacterium]|nr:hypothetical protein [Acetobacteraceae bacterium]
MTDTGTPAGWFSNHDFGEDYTRLLLEQYKLYVDTTNKISDRRGAAHTLLLTVNTSLITVYGFLLSQQTTSGVQRAPWVWIVPVAGMLIAAAWYLLVRSYRALNSAKFAVIREIESRLPARLFELEWHYINHGGGRAYLQLTRIEQYVPVVFGLCYVAALLSALRIY